jgi:hypothetical protein
MRILLSKILYYFGDLVSWFLRFTCFSWLYPFYSKIMILSSKLDIDGEVWENHK